MVITYMSSLTVQILQNHFHIALDSYSCIASYSVSQKIDNTQILTCVCFQILGNCDTLMSQKNVAY